MIFLRNFKVNLPLGISWTLFVFAIANSGAGSVLNFEIFFRCFDAGEQSRAVGKFDPIPPRIYLVSSA